MATSASAATTDLRLAVCCDPPDEGWPSMDLAAEMLVHAARALGVAVTELRPPLPRVMRRLWPAGRPALNADRVLGRFGTYPARLWRERRRFPAFHIADHSYAHLALALPEAVVGVYCHDLDAFRCVLEPDRDPRPGWFRAMAGLTLAGLRRAALVFHSTSKVREELLRHRLVPPERLVQAPLGVAPEFATSPSRPLPAQAAAALGSRRFLLHVGSPLPRKRVDLALKTVAAMRDRVPGLALVQLGAGGDAAVRRLAQELGMGHSLVLPGRLERGELSALYQHASLVLVTSSDEGFGLPVIEALACGAPVLASDIPVFREVGGAAVTYCSSADPASWADAAVELLHSPQRAPAPEVRAAWAAGFGWRRHAEIIVDAYRSLV